MIVQDKDKANCAFGKNTHIKIFTEAEIACITTKYSTPVGKGGFGEVYRGVFGDNNDLVAVKRYIRADLRKEFMEEVDIHSQIIHNNVVRLIGYCIEKNSLMMVTHYMSRGNLEDTLHCSDTFIPLDTRLGIAIGCAEALRYMHSMHLSSGSLVYHGDIKPANILSDENLVAKLSDFGLSRVLSGGITWYTCNVKGSIDYMDPIYLQEGRLSLRSDVYSFGSVLLELITRRRVKEGSTNLIGTLCTACNRDNGLKELFDVKIVNGSNVKVFEEIARLAARCLCLDIEKRPTMDNVSRQLVLFWKVLRRGPGIGWSIKSFGIFRCISIGNEILKKIVNFKILTKEELHQVTQNYSHALNGSSGCYVGTLEDNTAVEVKKFRGLSEEWKAEFINVGMVMSQIVHNNIIRLFGCCLEVDTPMFVYEHACNGSLYDILEGKEDFPLDLRLKIAIKTSEALEYLHSSAFGTITHGFIGPYNIPLDSNFMPKLTGFSGISRLVKNSERMTDDERVISGYLHGNLHCNNPIPCLQELQPVERDIYMFGVLLFSLIGRKNYRYPVDIESLVTEFEKAWRNPRGKKFGTIPGARIFYDKGAATENDRILFDTIGWLGMRCTCHCKKQPTMKEVAEKLRRLRRHWKMQIITLCG